jgi:DHA2 family methylenomycin A resistance protein-like MFS transporter
LGFALLGAFDRHTVYAAMLPAFALIPAGMGLAVPAMTTVVLCGADARRAGTSSGVLNAAASSAARSASRHSVRSRPEGPTL